VARHDREDPHSLEEQLAWLDAIKENEEAPAGTVTTAVEETAVSPYPKDPWLSVPTETDPATPPHFRAAVDSVYGQAAEEETTEKPTESGKSAGAFAVPPAGLGKDGNEGFLAPLKPLPQQEAGEKKSYSPGAFGGAESETTSRKGRGLFEPPKEQAGADQAEQPEESETPGAAPSSFGTGASETASTSVFSLRLPEEETPAASAESHEWGGTPAEPVKSREWGSTPAEPAAPPKWQNTQPEPAQAAEWESTHTDLKPPGWGEPAPEPDTTHDWKRTPAEPAKSHEWGNTPSEPVKAPAWGHTPAEPVEAPDWRNPPAEKAPEWGNTPAKPVKAPEWESTREGLKAPDWPNTPAEPLKAPDWGNTPAEPLKAPDWSTPAAEQPRPAREINRPKTEEPAGQPVREPYQARRRQTPVQAFSPPPRQPGGHSPTADSLDPESLLRGRRNGPSGGWRKMVYKASAGLIKPGEPPEVRRRRALVTRARTPVATGHHRVAVLSLKGGVGKTTTTVGLGATLAQIRGDRVIAVDANPDRGTLSDKLELETSATVRDLLNERGQIKRYVDIRAFTSQAPSRLEILASDRDPSVSEAFSAADYQAVAQVLENFYSICITDCGTGLLHSAMSGVLGLADQLVLVSSPSVDGARAASATLDWLEAHHYGELVRSATVVLCSVRPRSKSTVDLDKLEAHFAARCRAVIRVPYDAHLEEGAEIDLERLQEGTRDAYLRLAASVGDAFAPLMPITP
jgi:MinD-like ATPase involved in chromosome partitioning or flagellar assembly